MPQLKGQPLLSFSQLVPCVHTGLMLPGLPFFFFQEGETRSPDSLKSLNFCWQLSLNNCWQLFQTF